jgi:CMP-N-acetylneuraminic acid synthetase
MGEHTMSHRVLTIIPAKSCSTRLKKKNLMKLDGKTLVEIAIEKAIASGLCGTVMVSTESEEIAAIARNAGADVPFLRPSYLSHDPYEVDDVCLHVLDIYEKQGSIFDVLIILLPTSPLCILEDLVNAVDLFKKEDVSFLMSVSQMDAHYYNAMILDHSDLTMKPVFPGLSYEESKKKPIPVRSNGAITIVDVPAFKKAGTYYGEPLIGYAMPWERSVDVDTEEDFQFVSFLFERVRRKSKPFL